ncbi:MAG: NADH-quinone oxidoreductase subunit D [bacterium]
MRTLKTEEFMVNMGPQHPSTHGVLKLVLTLDGEIVKDCVPHIGFLHRGMEKIFENRTYHQIMPYTDRLDYLASMTNNFAYALAVEKMVGVKIPPRAEYIRVIMAELQRIASHLIWFSTFAIDLGATTPFLYGFRERELIIDLFEAASGNRLTYNYFRIGGISRDINPAWIEQAKKALDNIAKQIDQYEILLTGNPIFTERTKNIAVIKPELAKSYGLTGPNLRSCGIPLDLRLDYPYSVYPELEFNVITAKNGDTFDRYKVRLDEIRESIKMIKQAFDKLPEGDIMTKVPKVLKPEAGEIYSAIESPRGELGFYIVSDGSQKPQRCKVRAPSFANLAIIPDIAKGLMISDLVALTGSIDIVLGEIDR